MRDMPHSLLPVNDAPQYISNKYDMHELIRYVLDHLDEWQLIWYGSKVPRERIVWMNFRPLLVFVIIQRFFSSLALSPTQFTTFSRMVGPIFFIH